MKIKTRFILNVLTLICTVGATPNAHAVLPTPDGCYPNYTTAEGCKALNFLTTGAGNSGLGWYALYFNTTGNFNTGVGGGALALNNADSNTAVGAGAMLLNTTGSANTALGTDALLYNDDGSFNTAVGQGALFANTSGQENTAVGQAALGNHAPGSFNTAVGTVALLNTTGAENTGVGDRVLAHNTDGNSNTAVGFAALFSSTGGSNIALGDNAGGSVTTASNVICIGNSGQDVSNSCYIGQIFGATSTNGIAVFINSDGRLGTVTSSGRFKENITHMERASEAIFSLRPVTFHYKKEIDPAGMLQFGLVAEEVEKVNPDLVVRDKEGRPYSVRYDQVNAMLLNEFLKEHRKVEEQQAAITDLKSIVAQQQKEFQAAIAEQRKDFEARFKQQDAEIRRVNDRIELSKAASQKVADNE